jgi:hypothetical protein
MHGLVSSAGGSANAHAPHGYCWTAGNAPGLQLCVCVHCCIAALQQTCTAMNPFIHHMQQLAATGLQAPSSTITLFWRDPPPLLFTPPPPHTHTQILREVDGEMVSGELLGFMCLERSSNVEFATTNLLCCPPPHTHTTPDPARGGWRDGAR